MQAKAVWFLVLMNDCDLVARVLTTWHWRWL